MKFLYMMITLVFISTGLMAQTAIAPAVGDGTIDNPYEIASLENLYWIAAVDYLVPDPDQETRWSSHYVQIADIDASETENWIVGQYAGWSPIGFWSVEIQEPFTGSYDGQDHTIDGLFINRPYFSHLGLFAYTEEAAIQNLGVTNANVTGNSIVGILLGWNDEYSIISNCHTTGTLQGNGIYVGGLIGINEWSTISDSYSEALVNGTQYTGGLVGFNRYYSMIHSSYSTGNVTGTEGVVGGLAACNHHNSEIIDSYSTGNVSGDSNLVGGLVGWNHMDANIINSYSMGDVSGNFYVGGLVGDNSYDSNIIRCYSNGFVYGINDYIGGLTGINHYRSAISNSYSKGIVCGSNYVGGLVGENNDSEISHCYSIGSLDANLDIGGLVGHAVSGEDYADINNYWDTETSGLTISAMGEGRTTAEMIHPHAANTYLDWDFDAIWSADDTHEANQGYPYLTDVTLSQNEDLIQVAEPLTLSNYPNPFNPETTITFTLLAPGEVQLTIYNIKGQKVATLLHEYLETDEYSIIWKGRDDKGRLMPSGVYFYRLVGGGQSQSNKMLLLK